VTIRLDPMLQTVQLPTGVANLATGLANVDRDTLTHDGKGFEEGWVANAKRSMR